MADVTEFAESVSKNRDNTTVSRTISLTNKGTRAQRTVTTTDADTIDMIDAIVAAPGWNRLIAVLCRKLSL